MPEDDDEEEEDDENDSNEAVTVLEFEPFPSFFIGFSLVDPVAGEEPVEQINGKQNENTLSEHVQIMRGKG